MKCIVQNRRSGKHGSVLLEYMLVTLVIVLGLVGVSTHFVSPAGRSFDFQGTIEGENYGLFGDAYVHLVRRAMEGISSPLP